MERSPSCSNTNGIANTAIGYSALFSNTVGLGNTAVGDEALYGNTTGDANIAIGVLGAPWVTAPVAATRPSATRRFIITHPATANIALGYNAGHLTTGSNNIDIGNVGLEGERTPSVLEETDLGMALRPQHLSPVLAEPPTWATPLSWMETVS